MRLQTYLKTLRKTLFEPSYYLDILQANWWFSLRFFVISFLLLGLSLALRLIYVEIPLFSQKVEQATIELEENYPDDLVITWDQKELRLFRKTEDEQLEALTTPLVVDYPQAFDVGKLDLPEKLVTFTNRDGELSDITQDSRLSLLTVTNHQLFFNAGNDQFQEINLKELFLPIEKITIDQQSLPTLNERFNQQLTTTVRELNTFLPLILPPLFIFLSLGLSLWKTLLAFILLRIYGLKLTLGKAWQWTLHVSVAAELINQLSRLISPDHRLAMFSISFWIIFTFVLLTQRKKLLKLKIAGK